MPGSKVNSADVHLFGTGPIYFNEVRGGSKTRAQGLERKLYINTKEKAGGRL